MKLGKWIAAATALLVSLSLTTTAYAADSQTITVIYRKPSSYTVTIPASLNWDNAKDAAIKAVYDIEPGKALKVRISSGIHANGQITLKRSDKESAAKQNPVTPSTILASFSGYSETQKTGGTLTITPPAGVKAGSHSGILTFAIVVE